MKKLIVLISLLFCSMIGFAAPEKKLILYWEQFNPISKQVISYQDWAAFLKEIYR
ncbi:hypothetical protein [Piscirickettsia litoralis]|uniref:hypothetical protein n=1 Tax=Piscirickettsia litoralis TaxID=1891921 RepID=UPI001300F1E6|nr:hypothetical protein [Piscirickettsia litoralis]